MTGAVINAGNLDVNGGTLVVQGNAIGGTAAINGGTLEFGAASNVNTTFSPTPYPNTYTTIDDPAGTYTVLNAINDAGQIWGSYEISQGSNDALYQFLYSNGTYTTIEDPLSNGYFLFGPTGYGKTVLSDINDTGELVGYYDSTSHSHGLLYNGGSYTTIDAFGLATNDTRAYGINDAGQIVGTVNGNYPFLYSGGTYTTLDDPLATLDTLGISDTGQVVGDYDNNSGTHDLLATPAATGFRINLKYDAAALAAPQSFRDGIQQAANIL